MGVEKNRFCNNLMIFHWAKCNSASDLFFHLNTQLPVSSSWIYWNKSAMNLWVKATFMNMKGVFIFSEFIFCQTLKEIVKKYFWWSIGMYHDTYYRLLPMHPPGTDAPTASTTTNQHVCYHLKEAQKSPVTSEEQNPHIQRRRAAPAVDCSLQKRVNRVFHFY